MTSAAERLGRSELILKDLKKNYIVKNKEVKKNSIRDKRSFVDQLAKMAEKAVKNRDMGALHKITQRLCRKIPKCLKGVMDSDTYLLLIVNKRHGRSCTLRLFEN